MLTSKQKELMLDVLSGESIQVNVGDGGTTTLDDKNAMSQIVSNTHPLRVKPKIIMINGFEVPEPLKEPLSKGSVYYIAQPTSSRLWSCLWSGSRYEIELFCKGLLHSTKEGALAHVKALLSFTTQES